MNYCINSISSATSDVCIVITGQLAAIAVPLQSYGNTQRNCSFLNTLGSALNVKRRQGGVKKEEEKEEEEESIIFKIFSSLYGQLGAAGEHTVSVFMKASQVGMCVVIRFISTASLTRQACIFCPRLAYNLTVIWTVDCVCIVPPALPYRLFTWILTRSEY